MPREIVKNTFILGMNQDRAYSRYDNKNYLKATNFRLITDDIGGSTGSGVDVRGNDISFTLPTVQKTVKIKLKNPNDREGIKNVIINVNGRSASFTSTGLGTNLNLYEEIADFLNDSSNPYTGLNGFRAEFNSSGVVLTASSPINTFSQTHSKLDMSTYADAASNLVPIGSTLIRDELILFTAPETANGTGQIWKVTFDADNIASFDLIRNGPDSFNIAYPIEAVGRYELSDVKRVYWTDNNNSLRVLNISSGSTLVDTIDIAPAVTYDVPVPIELSQTGGSLLTGTYQYAYRLKQLGGPETGWSRFSAPFTVNEDNERSLGEYTTYSGS